GKADKSLGFDGERLFSGLDQILYTVSCRHDETLLPDQLKVTVTLQLPNKMVGKSRIYQAILGHKTMGVDLADWGHGPAAVYAVGNLKLDPKGAEPPGLDVHWGAIVCFGAISIARESGVEQWGNHPRKICRTGTNESKDYWVGVAMGNPALIDEDRYRAVAK